MPVSDIPTTLHLIGLGFVLGLRHALDADHVAAMATITTGQTTWRRSTLAGFFWGIGHTIALLVIGMLLLFLGLDLPMAVQKGVELAVAVMMIALGIRVFVTIRRGGKLHSHVHRHGEVVHSHPHLHQRGHRTESAPQPHTHQPSLVEKAILFRGRTPLVIGLVHGLAGSAGLMLLVAATISDKAAGMFYIASFGTGSIGGMMAMSALLVVPLRLASGRFPNAQNAIRIASGVASIAVGLFLGWNVALGYS